MKPILRNVTANPVIMILDDASPALIMPYKLEFKITKRIVFHCPRNFSISGKQERISVYTLCSEAFAIDRVTKARMDLPPMDPDVIWIVSNEVAEVMCRDHRSDCVVPDLAVDDGQGNLIGYRAFSIPSVT